MVCGGKVGGTLTERERSRDDQIAMGGSRRFTRLMKASSKPGSWSSGVLPDERDHLAIAVGGLPVVAPVLGT